MRFNRHPSKKLTDLYNKRPYQGQDPEKARFVFFGKDANWNAAIENEIYFPKIEEYLQDGVAFWKKYKIHHPFLLPEYKGDGKRYHTQFRKTYSDESVAEKISFIELVKFPTTGIAREKEEKNLFYELLFCQENIEHFRYIDGLTQDTNKKFFIAWGLANYIDEIKKRTGLLKKIPTDKTSLDISNLNEIGNFYYMKHLSDSISDETLAKVKKVLNDDSLTFVAEQQKPKQQIEPAQRIEPVQNQVAPPQPITREIYIGKPLNLIEKSFFQTLFFIPVKENVVVEINNFLYENPLSYLSFDTVNDFCVKHGTTPKSCKKEFVDFFYDFLDENSDIEKISILQKALDITEETSKDLHLLKIIMESPVIGVNINLEPHEKCHFRSSATWYEVGTIARNYNYSGFRTSIRVAKFKSFSGGVYYRFGNVRLSSTSVRGWKKKDVGEVYFTDRRIILIGEEKTISIPTKNILEIDVQLGGIVLKFKNRKNIFVETAKVGFFDEFIYQTNEEIFRNADIKALELSIIMSKYLSNQ